MQLQAKTLFLFLGLLTPILSHAAETTVRTEKEVMRGLLQDETFSLKPQLGGLAYTDSQGGSTGRFLYGITADMNVLTMIRPDLTQAYFGPSIGAMFTHLGEPGSNAFGTEGSQSAGQTGSNLLMIPLNVKGGYAFTDYYRLGLHAGGNGIYRSVANSMNLGDGSDRSSSLWKLYPNLGADLDVAMSRKVALTLRPDWTLTPESNLFAATLGVGIFLD